MSCGRCGQDNLAASNVCYRTFCLVIPVYLNAIQSERSEWRESHVIKINLGIHSISLTSFVSVGMTWVVCETLSLRSRVTVDENGIIDMGIVNFF